MESFFKRWIYLVTFLTLLSFMMGVISFLSWQNYYENNYSIIDNECYEYLLSRDQTWTSSGDSYYSTQCDLQNPSSEQSRQLKISTDLGRNDDFYISLGMTLLSIIALSFLARWLITGKVKIKLRK